MPYRTNMLRMPAAPQSRSFAPLMASLSLVGWSRNLLCVLVLSGARFFFFTFLLFEFGGGFLTLYRVSMLDFI